MNKKPGLFIGSAKESLKFANALQKELKDVALTEVWDQCFRSGHYTLEELTRKSNEVDFAAFILGQEDETTSKGKITLSPRDNVVYEAGLFSGRLGVSKVFLLVNVNGTKKPTDWDGLVNLFYDPEQSEEKAIHDAAENIRKQINEWKLTTANSLEQQVPGAWWQFVVNSDEGSVLSLMKILYSEVDAGWKIWGNAWSDEGKKIAEYWSRAIAFDLKDKKLFYYWEGKHPFDKSIPVFLGVGEIKYFEADSGIINKAEGWFSETPLAKLSDTVRKSTIYTRAGEKDIKILEGNNQPGIKELIKQRIKELKELTSN